MSFLSIVSVKSNIFFSYQHHKQGKQQLDAGLGVANLGTVILLGLDCNTPWQLDAGSGVTNLGIVILCWAWTAALTAILVRFQASALVFALDGDLHQALVVAHVMSAMCIGAVASRGGVAALSSAMRAPLLLRWLAATAPYRL